MLHIDGDMIAYRVACAVGDEGDAGLIGWTIDSFMSKNILIHFGELEPYHVYLSGKTNFRYDVAITAPYKGNRANKPRPVHLPAARQHLIDLYGATVSVNCEADDTIAIAATQDGGTVVSLDKDFDQLTNPIFNFVTFETRQATQLEATKTLYKQFLTGDAVDNIIGVEGCGPGMASELIDGCTKEADMMLICIDQLGSNRFLENAGLVFLRRDSHPQAGFITQVACEVLDEVQENINEE